MSCSNCNGNCANGLKCGCQDTMLTTPPAYPTPVGCLTPEPCSEVLDAQCVIYTGMPIMCNQDEVVPTNTNVAEALSLIVQYFCQG